MCVEIIQRCPLWHTHLGEPCSCRVWGVLAFLPPDCGMTARCCEEPQRPLRMTVNPDSHHSEGQVLKNKKAGSRWDPGGSGLWLPVTKPLFHQYPPVSSVHILGLTAFSAWYAPQPFLNGWLLLFPISWTQTWPLREVLSDFPHPPLTFPYIPLYIFW